MTEFVSTTPGSAFTLDFRGPHRAVPARSPLCITHLWMDTKVFKKKVTFKQCLML